MQPSNRVAVIAVHGVGDHQKFGTARIISNLLGTFRQYHSFSEQILRIPLKPLQVSPGETSGRSGRSPLEVAVLRKADKYRQSKGPAESADYVFIHGQLKGHYEKDPEMTYDTIRVRGQRDTDGKIVDIYEVWWSDIARAGSGVLRIFGELYQLLLHLSRLGAHTAYAFWHENFGERGWDNFAWSTKWCSLLLSVPIAIFNLILIGLAFLLVTSFWIAGLHRNTLGLVSSLCAAIPVMFLSELLVFKNVRAKYRLLSPLIIGLGTGYLGWQLVFSRPARIPTELVVNLATQTLIGIFLFWVAKRYDRRRPGAATFFLIAALLTFVSFLAFLVMRLRDTPVWPFATATLNTFEFIYGVLFGVWLAFYVLLVTSHFLGIGAAMIGDPEIRNRAERTRWTARLTIGLSSLSFILVNISLWAAFVVSAESLVPKAFAYKSLLFKSYFPTIKDYSDKIFSNAGPRLFFVIALLASFAVLIALLSLLPVALADLLPSVFDSKGQREKDSVELGGWLDVGFRGLRWTGRLLYACMAIVYPLGIILGALFRFDENLTRVPVFAQINNWTSSAIALKSIAILAALVGGPVAGLFLLQGRLKKLAPGFRTTLDTLLDVDQYLREHPFEGNPKARIFARYASLLRHIAKQDNEQRYEAVVICAHSQGTVISADLLRFIQQERNRLGKNYEPELQRLTGEIPIFLFTMGCPLRQLYGLRFPSLYRWARHMDTAPWTDPRMKIPLDQSPSPDDLGVRQWVNAYRSGDYIGRHLWRSDNCDFLCSQENGVFPVSEDVSGKRKEFCIGPGAHTHYWDKYGEKIADELDGFI